MQGTQLLLKAKYLKKEDALVTYSCPTVSFLLALTSDLPESQGNLDTLCAIPRRDCFITLNSAFFIQVFDSLLGVAGACFSAL